MSVILLIGSLDGLLLVQNVLLTIAFLLEWSRQRRLQMTVVSSRRLGGPWRTERQLRTTRGQPDTAQQQTGANWATGRRREAQSSPRYASTVRLLRPSPPSAAPTASQVPATRLALASRADSAGLKRKAVPQVKEGKLVSGPALHETAGQRSRRVTLRRQRLLERRDRTLDQRVQRLRAGTTFLQRNRLKPTTQFKYVLA